MALPRSGFLKESIELLRIETDLFDLYIQGKPFHPTVEALHLHRGEDEEWVHATLEVITSSNLKVSSVTHFSAVQGKMLPWGEEPVFPLFYENQNYEFVLQKKTDQELSFYHENVHLRRAVKSLGKNLLVGSLNFQNEVGYSDLEVRHQGKTLLSLRIEVFPVKMDYQRDFQMILREVNEQVYNLAFDFLRKTYQLTGLRETQHQSLTEFFMILKSLFQQLIHAVERIQLAPHNRLVPIREVRRADQVKRAGKYGAPGPEEEDINTMHRYRDAIMFENPVTGEFERSMFGAYVLFPYPDEERFREHRFYKSIKKVNIGAFPFLPNNTRLMEEFLDELILDSPEKAYERSTRPRGTKTYYEDKLQGKNVLIGSMRDKVQLSLCLQHQIYWIPLKNLTREQSLLTQLEWVGLYQSHRTFGPKDAGIFWAGKILSWQVVRRYEIKYRRPRPGTENELYVLFQIESWKKRKEPIKPGGYGIYTHLFTTAYMLERAEEIAELKLSNEEELKEWREKRRRGKVQVKLDDEYVDRAQSVVRVEVVE